MTIFKKIYYFFRYWRDDVGGYPNDPMLITAKEAWAIADIFTRDESL